MLALPLKIMLAHIIRRYNKNEKQNKIHIVATIPKSNIKIVERGKSDISSTQVHDRSQSMAWYRHFNNNNGGDKLVLWS